MRNNRNLECKIMDRLDHALGRPSDPQGETARNFFGVSVADITEVAEMKASPYWTHTRDFMGTAGFCVSKSGKAALASYLEEHWTPPKRYEVTWNGRSETVAAKNPGAAKYDVWLACDFTDLKFGDFLRDARARVAH